MNNQSVDAAGALVMATGGSRLVVVVIILAAGLIGGWAAYLTQSEDVTQTDTPRVSPSRLRFFVLGIIAAACVPLFLSLVQSQLLVDTFRSGTSDQFIAFLVFAGLYLIAAFSARTFIDSISRRVLQQVEQVKERQAEVEQQVARNSEKIDATAETVDEQEAQPTAPGDHQSALEAISDAPPITGDERRVLQTMTGKSFRTVSGMTSESGLGRSLVQALLRELAKKHLVVPSTSPTSGGLRWMITPLGRAALREA